MTVRLCFSLLAVTLVSAVSSCDKGAESVNGVAASGGSLAAGAGGLQGVASNSARPTGGTADSVNGGRGGDATAGSGGSGGTSGSSGAKGGDTNGGSVAIGGRENAAGAISAAGSVGAAFGGERGVAEGEGGASAETVAGAGGAGGADDDIIEHTDAQILHVVSTANQAAIEQGTIAMERAQSDHVDSFAKLMVSQHGSALSMGSQLAQQIGLSGNPVSVRLQNKSAAVVSELQLASDAEFDATYTNAQVASHQRFVELLDGGLIPGSDNSQLRTYLETLRASVAEHLASAQSLVNALP